MKNNQPKSMHCDWGMMRDETQWDKTDGVAELRGRLDKIREGFEAAMEAPPTHEQKLAELREASAARKAARETDFAANRRSNRDAPQAVKHERKIYSERQICAALTVADFHAGIGGITRDVCDEMVQRLDGAPMSAVLASAYLESQKALRMTQGFRTGDMRTSLSDA